MTRDSNEPTIVLANFGGPRNLKEIPSFLKALLHDQDVIRTPLPGPLHRLLFSVIAQRRAKKIAADYEAIGGGSPIFSDTEAIANKLRNRLSQQIITFHRYLPNTHRDFVEKIKKNRRKRFLIFPLFPQFTYATTGSIARWFSKNLPKRQVDQFRWVKSYPSQPKFLQAHQEQIRHFLSKRKLDEKEVILLFSAHGVPQKFIRDGDIYEDECWQSYQGVMQGFPRTLSRLAFQSKFGPGQWLSPYTSDVCESILSWNQGCQHVVFVPLSFTSDHIETLFEIEQDYMPLITKQGLHAHRVPALTQHPTWIDSIVEMIEQPQLCNNRMLIRK